MSASTKLFGAAGLGVVTLAFAAFFAQARAGYDPVTRVYYIAAEEVDWDYVPGGQDRIMGRPVDETINMGRTIPNGIGPVWKKAVYREYTDETFTTRKERSPEWRHLGILGPVVRGVVGDTIKVVFRNMGTHPYSVHPHGVIYDKDSEGAPYEDGTSGADKADDAVPPGGTHTYVWPVTERAGPAPGEGSSVLWMYHSHTNESMDVNAGLIGALIVTAAERARPDGTPDDVDRELVAAFLEFDEMASWFFEENLQRAPEPQKFDRSTNFGNIDFVRTLVPTVNGHLFGNTVFEMREGERVRWYVFSNTNFGDLHAPHWHGNVAVANHMKTDVLALVPMGMVVADMVPDNVGTWFFHCHVREHNEFGMQAKFVVSDGQTPVASRGDAAGDHAMAH